VAYSDVESILKSIVQADGNFQVKIFRKLVDALIQRWESGRDRTFNHSITRTMKLINDRKLLIDSESSIFNGVQAIGTAFDPTPILHLIQSENIKYLCLSGIEGSLNRKFLLEEFDKRTKFNQGLMDMVETVYWCNEKTFEDLSAIVLNNLDELSDSLKKWVQHNTLTYRNEFRSRLKAKKSPYVVFWKSCGNLKTFRTAWQTNWRRFLMSLNARKKL
jgi:phosphopantetheine adenylyltransferase